MEKERLRGRLRAFSRSLPRSILPRHLLLGHKAIHTRNIAAKSNIAADLISKTAATVPEIAVQLSPRRTAVEEEFDRGGGSIRSEE